MKNKSFLIKINKLIKNDIKVVDETRYEFTKDEKVVIESLIKCFRNLVIKYPRVKKLPKSVIKVSSRISIDFGFFAIPDNNGELFIYLSNNRLI